VQKHSHQGMQKGKNVTLTATVMAMRRRVYKVIEVR